VENLGESRKGHIKDHHTFITPLVLLKTGNINRVQYAREWKKWQVRGRCIL